MAERAPIVDTASQKTGEEVEQETSSQEAMPKRFSRNTFTGALLFNFLAFILPALAPIVDTASQKTGEEVEQETSSQEAMPKRFSRNTFTGALLFNFLAFILPALYDTLVKIWISKIDSSLVVTTDSYTYISTIVEVLNEGLPRAAYLVIGDPVMPLTHRVNLVCTLVVFQMVAGLVMSLIFLAIVFQMVAGLVMSLIFLASASQLAAAFVPESVRAASLGYVRISSFSALTSATETAVSFATRSLDRPDVPLMINFCRTLANIILDFIFLSTFRVRTGREPTINTQASIRMACNGIGCIAGLLYFIYVARRLRLDEDRRSVWMPKWSSFVALAKPGLHTLVESAVRNALYLWLIHGVVAMGSDYATAWGIFNTIRWGLVMVPINTLAATASTFVGHEWGLWRERAISRGSTQASLTDIIGHEWGLWRERAISRGSTQASLTDIIGPRKFFSTHKSSGIFRPALISTFVALVIEVPLCLAFSFGLTRPFARYLSGSDTIAKITAHMWRSIDWCYIMYGVDTQLATILLATRPKCSTSRHYIMYGVDTQLATILLATRPKWYLLYKSASQLRKALPGNIIQLCLAGA
ncbi:unnamed protein product [Rhizoctonia solani]|uniref:Uncharacterized protein n=1 Tax=Rhizoctonia solani TaxID=456999 RepID=A0A8H3AMZ9_9AGAM|nr:unnamed protein product [Rhizoctonia solani]